MQILKFTQAEVVAAVADPPRLLSGGAKAQVVLSGQIKRLASDGQWLDQRFFLPCTALGKLAARFGTLGVGEALLLRGVLAWHDGDFQVLVDDFCRLPHVPARLTVGDTGVPSLHCARQRVSLRGLVVVAAQTQRLQSGQTVANARLGLQVRSPASGGDAGLVMLELAAYGPLAERLNAVTKGTYLEISGQVQRRRGNRPGQVFSRLEVQELEVLHETRAFH